MIPLCWTKRSPELQIRNADDDFDKEVTYDDNADDNFDKEDTYDDNATNDFDKEDTYDDDNADNDFDKEDTYSDNADDDFDKDDTYDDNADNFDKEDKYSDNTDDDFDKEDTYDDNVDDNFYKENILMIGLKIRNIFKQHLLDNWSKFKIISQNCSLWCLLPKLHKWFHSVEQRGCQSSR